VRLIAWNVNRRVTRLDEQAAAVAGRAPDLVCLQEVTPARAPAGRRAPAASATTPRSRPTCNLRPRSFYAPRMGEDAAGALRKELGAAPPKGLEGLSPEEQADLAAALRDARVRQALALDSALDRSLGLIPRLLRGPVKRIVLG
jgi:hypothetical protein